MIETGVVGRWRAVYGRLLVGWLVSSGCQDASTEPEMDSSEDVWPPSVVMAPLLNVAANDVAARSPLDATDGERLFVDAGDAGAVMSLPSSGGDEPIAVASTEGFAPRGLVVAEVDDRRHRRRRFRRRRRHAGREHRARIGPRPREQRDRVYVLDARTRKLAQIVEPFDSFSRAAGLHRAHNANVFAWADSEANDSGTVYRVKL